jgi:hypothetical protein
VREVQGVEEARDTLPFSVNEILRDLCIRLRLRQQGRRTRKSKNARARLMGWSFRSGATDTATDPAREHPEQEAQADAQQGRINWLLK